MIRSITLHEEIDNTPKRLEIHGELDQGDSFDNIRIYKVTLADGKVQYLKQVITHDSYGAPETVGNLTLATPEQKTVTVWS